jgi:energy-coupling factor transporter ATP-binding protein EcfA2
MTTQPRDNERPADTGGFPPISARDVCVQYRNASEPTLSHINLDIGEGEFVGLVGPTGCGKSTLLHLLAGAVPHNTAAEVSGELRLFGSDSRELSFRKITAQVGLVLQDPEAQLFNLFVRDEIVWGLENRGLSRAQMRARLTETMELFGIEHLRDRVTYDLSGGEKQRVVLAAVFALKPDVILLDNPTSQLDPLGAAAVIAAVNRLASTGQTIVMVEDKIDELLASVTRIVAMDNGTIVFDGTADQFAAARAMRKRLGLRASQVADLAFDLQDRGVAMPSIPLTVDAAVPVFQRVLQATPRPAREPAAAPDTSVEAERSRPLLQAESIAFTYPPPRGVRALTRMDLAIAEGEFLAIVGRNGSGKTTLAKCLSGFLRPTRGRVRVDGHEIGRLAPSRRVRLIGYVFQNPDHQLFKNTVWEEVAFGLTNIGTPVEQIEASVSEMLAAVELTSKAHMHPFRLSKGDRQRLAIAAVAVLRPALLIVDEPTTGQDPARARDVLDLLARLNRDDGIAIAIISHAMDLVAQYARRTIVLADGDVLADGPTRDVFSDPQMLAKSSVAPPAVTRLGLEVGLVPPPLTVPEAAAMILTQAGP